jgi:DNA-binding MarR family transcriptional regulator
MPRALPSPSHSARPARQLARSLAVTPPDITVLLDRLVARGLVVRTRSPSDARVQPLRATEAGAALASQSTQRLLAGEDAALAGLSTAERGMLIELLHKVALARGRGSPG